VKILKVGRFWFLSGKSTDWAFGLSVTRKGVDLSFLFYWVCLEIA